MIRFSLYLVSLLFFSGCASIFGLEAIKPHKKAFEEEDSYIMYALRAEQLKEYNASSSIFNTLYEKSDKKEYIYRSLQNYLTAKENEKVVTRVDEISDGSLDDYSLIRFKIMALIQLNKLEEASLLAVELVGFSNDVKDYILVSDIYIKLKKFDLSVKYLESAYIQNYNERILDRMSIILYVNLQRKKDAIAYLETHTRVHGCSKLICSRLIGFYSNDNNIDGLLSASLRLYEIEQKREVAKKIIQVYLYQKNYLKLISFLESSKVDDNLLLQLYSKAQNYKKASPLAHKIYMETGDVFYLGQSAIFKYESREKKKNSKVLIKSVIKDLKKVLKQEESTLYLNYLGYILIDHNINIKDGMKYIQKALKIEPNSAYYLDSLAWGYYKLGSCKKANKLMQRVAKMQGANDKEVMSHVKAIEKCIKNKKKVKK